MYYPRSIVPFHFNTSQISVLKYYYKNKPYLSVPVLKEIYSIFEKRIAIIHIKYWFISRRNSEIFNRFAKNVAPKQTNYPREIPKLEVPMQKRPLEDDDETSNKRQKLA